MALTKRWKPVLIICELLTVLHTLHTYVVTLTQSIFSCPPFSFRCSYGGCIPGKKECDGRSDCVDNSDEVTLNCPGVKETYSRAGNCRYGSRLSWHMTFTTKNNVVSVITSFSAKTESAYTKIRSAMGTWIARMPQKKPVNCAPTTIAHPMRLDVHTAHVSRERVVATKYSIAWMDRMKLNRFVGYLRL